MDTKPYAIRQDSDRVTLGAVPRIEERQREDPEETIDLWKIVLFLWDMRAFILGGTLACAAAALMLSLMLPKTYAAMATVFVTPPTYASTLSQPAFSVEAYARLAESDFIQARVGASLRSTGVLGPTEGVGRFITVLYPSREPQKPFLPLIGFTVEAGSASKARDIANMWATLFVQEEQKLSTVGKASSVDFILEEFPKASAMLLEQERALKNSQDSQAKELTALKTQLSVDMKKAQLDSRQTFIVDLETKLLKTKVDLGDSQHVLAQLEQELARTPQYLNVSKSITDDALWQAVNRGGSAADAARISETLGGTKLQSQEINPVFVSLAERVSTERVRYNSLVPAEQMLLKQINDAKDEADRLRGDFLQSQLAVANLEREQKVEIAATQRNVDEASSRFKKLDDKIGDAQIAKAEQTSNVKVGSLAELPSSPSSPNVALNVVVAGGLGFLASIVAAWVLDKLRQRQPTASQPAAAGGA